MNKVMELLLFSALLGVVSCDGGDREPFFDTESETLECIEDGYIIERESDLEALQPCTRITGNLRIAVEEGVERVSLPNLESVDGDLSIGSPSLTELDMSRLTTVGGRLFISSNDNLTSLAGLSSLTTVAAGDWKTVHIYNNAALTSLAGLSSLTTEDGRGFNFDILGNDSLTSLTGLEGITTLIGLSIQRNPELTSLAGLSNLDSVASHVAIHNNAALPYCEICPWLFGVNVTDGAFISGNLSEDGCDTCPCATCP